MRAAEFYRGLASLLRAGVLPEQALGHLAQDGSLTRAESEAAVAAIRDGRAFTAALTGLPVEERALLEAGEQSGRLEEMCDRLGGLRERERTSWRGLARRLMWPAATLVTAILLIPIGLLGVSGKLTAGRWLIIVACILVPVVLLVRFFRRHRDTPEWRARLDRILNVIPGFGAARTHRRRARFCGALEAAYDAGVPVAQALRFASETARGAQTSSAVKVVEEGRSIATALGASGIMTPAILARLETAEQAGELSSTLRTVAADESERADVAMDRALTTLGAVFYLLVGLLVAWYAFTVMGRVYSGF